MDFDLDRFVDAQAGLYDQVLAELADGKKRTHWMWYFFPQLLGLGQSETSIRFAIRSLQEAQAYACHPVLGPRLVACTEALLALECCSIQEVFWYPDDLKFHSSMTLFNEAVRNPSVFSRALSKYFDGQLDERTLNLLSRSR